MTKSTHYARTSALPAIAAALALSSTPVFAQAQPLPTDTAPANTVQTSPAPDAARAPAEPAATTGPAGDAGASTTETAVAPQTDTAPVPRHTSVVHPRKAAAHVPVIPAHSTTTRIASRQSNAPHSAVAKAAIAPAAPAPASSDQLTSAANPQVNVQAKQIASSTRSASGAQKHDNTVPIAAGGVLALLAIGGAAVAANRRREDGEEWLEGEETEREPAASAIEESPGPAVDEEQPALVAPPVSAFGWRTSEQSPAAVAEEPMNRRDDRAPGEGWVERAYRGPSPLNPSASLKTRLKRAAFFDKRERDAAAGLAQPVEPTAGLPGRMVDDNRDETQSNFA